MPIKENGVWTKPCTFIQLYNCAQTHTIQNTDDDIINNMMIICYLQILVVDHFLHFANYDTGSFCVILKISLWVNFFVLQLLFQIILKMLETTMPHHFFLSSWQCKNWSKLSGCMTIDYPSLEPELFTAVLRNSFQKNSCVTISFFCICNVFTGHWQTCHFSPKHAHMRSVSLVSEELFSQCEHQFIGQHL